MNGKLQQALSLQVVNLSEGCNFLQPGGTGYLPVHRGYFQSIATWLFIGPLAGSGLE